MLYYGGGYNGGDAYGGGDAYYGGDGYYGGNAYAEGASAYGGEAADGAGAGAKGGDKPWDEADIDKWAPVKIRPEDNPGGMIEESSFAVLFPKVGEMVGGSQREERLDVVESEIVRRGMETAPYWWYNELRRYGTVPHGGFGLGFERMLMYLTGMQNIRDVLPYPRTPGQASF